MEIVAGTIKEIRDYHHSVSPSQFAWEDASYSWNIRRHVGTALAALK